MRGGIFDVQLTKGLTDLFARHARHPECDRRAVVRPEVAVLELRQRPRNLAIKIAGGPKLGPSLWRGSRLREACRRHREKQDEANRPHGTSGRLHAWIMRRRTRASKRSCLAGQARTGGACESGDAT